MDTQQHSGPAAPAKARGAGSITRGISLPVELAERVDAYLQSAAGMSKDEGNFSRMCRRAIRADLEAGEAAEMGA